MGPRSKRRTTDAAVGAVFETDREGDTAGKLSVELRLCGARTDGTPGDEVGDVLRRDGVEQLRADGHAHVCEVAQQLAGEAETLVDFEGAIDVGVVDEALPADGRAGLLEIDTHDNVQVLLRVLGVSTEEARVLEGGFGVVDRARAKANGMRYSMHHAE